MRGVTCFTRTWGAQGNSDTRDRSPRRLSKNAQGTAAANFAASVVAEGIFAMWAEWDRIHLTQILESLHGEHEPTLFKLRGASTEESF